MYLFQAYFNLCCVVRKWIKYSVHVNDSPCLHRNSNFEYKVTHNVIENWIHISFFLHFYLVYRIDWAAQYFAKKCVRFIFIFNIIDRTVPLLYYSVSNIGRCLVSDFLHYFLRIQKRFVWIIYVVRTQHRTGYRCKCLFPSLCGANAD